MAGTLFVVATPIGNLEDITARALRVLREVAVIAAEDTRRTAHLLAHYAIPTRTTSFHEHNERTKAASLLARLSAGDSLALVSDAGTPAISDPGGRLVSQAIEQGIRVEPVPGASAIMAALSVFGLSVESFTFLGFPPVRSKDRKQWLLRLAACRGTVVFYEAPHRIRKTLQEVHSTVGECRALVARELTKAHEQLVYGPISNAIETLKPRGEFTVVLNIGQSTEHQAHEGPSAREIADEFGRLTISRTATRRAAIAQISLKYGLRPNDVYSALEEIKNSSG